MSNGNPTSTGMGQGSAQVFDTSGLLRTYARMIQYNQIRDQQEQQSVSKMLSGLQTDKLRSEDMPEYNKMFNDLQNIYIKNKGLYSRPMSNPAAYQEGQRLITAMQTLSSESKEMEKFSEQVGKVYMDKGPDHFEDESITKLMGLRKLSVSKIKEVNGGRLPSYEDVQYTPKPLDPEKIAKVIDDLAGHAPDGLSYENISVKGTGDNGIPKGYVQTRADKVYNPVAIGSATEFLYNNPNDRSFRKNFTKQFSDMTPEQIAAEQAHYDKQVGGGLKITDPLTLAKATMMMTMGRIPGKPETVRDQDFEQQQAMQRMNAEELKQMRMSVFNKGLELQNYESKLKLKGKYNTADDNQLRADAETLIKTLNTGTDEQIRKIVSPFMRAGSVQNVEWISPAKAKLEDYTKRILVYNKNSAGATISEKDIAAWYKEGAKIAAIRFTDKDSGKTKYLIINPKSNTAVDQAQGILKSFGGTRKHGLDLEDQ